MAEILEAYLLTLIPILVAMDPLGNLPIFVGMTRDLDRLARRRLIHRAILTAAFVGIVFVVGGRAIFNFIGITQYDFQIGGGLVLLTLSLASLFERRRRAQVHEDTAVVPLALPLIAGPAILTTLIIYNDINGHKFGAGGAMLCVTVAFVTALSVQWVAFVFVDKIIARLGMGVLQALERIIYLILAAIAVMMIRSGVQGLLR
jgi:multiple antibiotic resistance protein